MLADEPLRQIGQTGQQVPESAGSQSFGADWCGSSTGLPIDDGLGDVGQLGQRITGDGPTHEETQDGPAADDQDGYGEVRLVLGTADHLASTRNRLVPKVRTWRVYTADARNAGPVFVVLMPFFVASSGDEHRSDHRCDNQADNHRPTVIALAANGFGARVGPAEALRGVHWVR